MEPNYSGTAIVRAIVIATTIAGTLDILSGFVFAVLAGGTPLGVLRGIGGAVVTDESYDGFVLAAIGLILHFTIMTLVATAYLLLAARLAPVNRFALASGLACGTLWVALWWIVLPWRWPILFPLTDPLDMAIQSFSHILLVGIPIALVARAARLWHFPGAPSIRLGRILI